MLFLEEAENSLLIAQHIKELQPSEGQPKKLFWDYWTITVSYYSMLYAIKTYTKRRLEEIFDNATDFVAKIRMILQKK